MSEKYGAIWSEDGGKDKKEKLKSCKQLELVRN